MKKLLLLVVVLALAISFSACQIGAGDLGVVSSSPSEAESSSIPSEPEPSEYAKNIEGLIAKLSYHGYVNADEKTAMTANIIGADTGYRFPSGKGAIEVYEYSTENLGDIAKRCMEEVKTTGKLTVLENVNSVNAMLSNNEKYLLIYNDNSTDEESVSHRTAVENLVKEFE